MSFKYITNDELAEIVKTKQAKEDYLIVDVRDDDFRGGNIRGAQNSPSSTFHTDVDKLVQETKETPIIVFHCMLSQQRGPKAARVYAETRDALQAQGKDKDHEVYVLRGGFGDFQAKFRNDPELLENYDAKGWKEGHF